jgi:hypothetical protein
MDEGSAKRRDLYLTTQNAYKRQIFMSQGGFEPLTPSIERAQTHILDCVAAGTGYVYK